MGGAPPTSATPMILDADGGARLYFAEDMARPEEGKLAGGKFAAFSASCPTRERPNEDSAAVIAVDGDRAVLAVADGVGGIRGGGTASRRAIEELALAVVRGMRNNRTLRDSILDGFEAANHALVFTGQGVTTLAAVELDGDDARPYHVGDSTILLAGAAGQMKHVTTAHSPVGYAFGAGVLTEEDALWHPERHLVSNVVGSPDMSVEIGPVLKLQARDTILVGSDGVFDNLRLAELADLAHGGKPLQAAERVVQTCRERMRGRSSTDPCKPDDLTFLLFRAGSRSIRRVVRLAKKLGRD